MNHNTTPASRTFAHVAKTNYNSAGRRSLPYGMSDNPHTGAQRSPCVDFYGDGKGVICPEFKKRQESNIRRHVVTTEPAGDAILPKVCRECQRRIDYADGMDPSRHMAPVTQERRDYVDKYYRQAPKGTRGHAMARALAQTEALGYPDYKEALRALYFDEDLATYRIGELLGISHTKVTSDLKKFGFALRQRVGGRKKTICK